MPCLFIVRPVAQPTTPYPRSSGDLFVADSIRHAGAAVVVSNRRRDQVARVRHRLRERRILGSDLIRRYMLGLALDWTPGLAKPVVSHGCVRAGAHGFSHDHVVEHGLRRVAARLVRRLV